MSDDLPAQPGGGQDPLQGGFDLGSMMQMAADMQSRMAQAQEQLVSTEVVGTAGGGLVEVVLNGHLHLVRVHIDPGAIDAEDPTILEDLVKAAWQDAHDQVAELQAATNPLGGLGLDPGGLGGLLGGGG